MKHKKFILSIILTLGILSILYILAEGRYLKSRLSFINELKYSRTQDSLSTGIIKRGIGNKELSMQVHDFIYNSDERSLKLGVSFKNSDTLMTNAQIVKMELRDNKGNIYDERSFTTSKGLINTFQNNIFEDIKLDNINKLYLDIYSENSKDRLSMLIFKKRG